MARTNAVWGIDIGQCALKALRCRAHDEPDKVLVESFDYIEYPKILSQPGAEPAELIAGALKQFLARNSVLGDQVAISVPGQSGLARFIKLPPVEAKKIPDIVRYEAKQQIPFDLNDVIWDYQRMGGGAEEEGFVLETEIGLFAMKRDAVFRALEPFDHAGIEVDAVQLTPLSLYNFVVFDQLRDLPPPDQYDPENPPESVVLISLGTDATDLVVTNGYRVWQRSVPLGGNHFTKALTKELKQTFDQAEHLKRNAATSQDPKAVFQAMRPVFSDLQTELQRSLNYFTNLDRAAKIGRVVALGNAFKLPGLRRYLSQSLGLEIERLETFRGLDGPQVISAPAFKENLLSFGVCYGLALQGLGMSGLKTNLLPKEILRNRLIREKKPWAVAAAAVLLLGCSVAIGRYGMALSTVNEGDWKAVEERATGPSGIATRVTKLKSDADAEAEKFDEWQKKNENFIGRFADRDDGKSAARLSGTIAKQKTWAGFFEQRVLWPELLQAINACLPRGDAAKPVAERTELHVTTIDCQQVGDLSKWFVTVAADYQAPAEGGTAAPGGAPATPPPAAPPGGRPAPAAPPAPPARPAPGVPRAAAPAVMLGSSVMAGLESGPADHLLAQRPPAGEVDPTVRGGGRPPAPGGFAPPPQHSPPPGAGGPGPGTPGGPLPIGESPGEQPVITGGPTGPGWIVRIRGWHYHNADKQGAQFVRDTLIKNLDSGTVTLPAADGKGTETVSLKDLGISYVVLVNPAAHKAELKTILKPGATGRTDTQPPPAGHAPGGGGAPGGFPGLGGFGAPPPAAGPGGGGAAAAPAKPEGPHEDENSLTLWAYPFEVQFCWKPTPPSQRRANKEQANKEKKDTQANN